LRCVVMKKRVIRLGNNWLSSGLDQIPLVKQVAEISRGLLTGGCDGV